MDKRQPPETDKFRMSDYLAASERELALSPHAPRTPTICAACSEDLHSFCTTETCGCTGSKNCKDRSDRAKAKSPAQPSPGKSRGLVAQEKAAVRNLFIKKRYIEVVGGFTTWKVGLTLWNVFCIGEFTRENVHDWLANDTCRNRRSDDWFVDFHAVCGEQDIPWATKEGFECYSRGAQRIGGVMQKAERRSVPRSVKR